jgi:hypothetical protein
MKIGDIVMFVDTGRYAKWFFGRLATVESYTPTHSNSTRGASCRVRWLEPVKYHDGFTEVSDFSANQFEVC